MFDYSRVRHTQLRRVKVLLLSICLVGAAYESWGALEKERWCKLTTSEFDLYGYVPRNQLQSLADSLLSFNAVTDTYMPGERISGHLLRVVAFRNQKEFLDVFQQEHFIGFMHPSLREHLLAFVLEEKKNKPLTVAFHEYTHFLARSRLNTYVPLWYEEGFAQFLSTMEIRRHSAIVGEIPRRRLSRAIRRNADNIDKILNSTPPFDWSRHDITENYLVAWSIAHMLFRGVDTNNEPLRERIPDLLDQMSRGILADQALKDITQTDSESLVALVRDHLSRTSRHEQVTQIHQDWPKGEHPIHCLDNFERKVLLGEVLIDNNPRLAKAYLLDAHEDRPDDPDLLVAMSRAHADDYETSYALAKRAYDADEENVEANIRIADLLTYPCLLDPVSSCSEYLRLASSLYLTALDKAPMRVDAAFGLGVVYLESGRAGDGLNYLRVAHQRAPWSPRTNLFLGDAYRLIGDYANAEIHLTKAVLWETQDSWRAKAIELLSSIQATQTAG